MDLRDVRLSNMNCTDGDIADDEMVALLGFPPGTRLISMARINMTGRIVFTVEKPGDA